MATSPLHLYMAPGSCAFASHIVLRESGLDFELTRLAAKTGYPAEFKALNPKGRVPILRIGDATIVTEGTAIMTAISQLAPHKHLLGKTNMDTVRTYEWFNYISGTLHTQGFGGLFRPNRFSDDESQYDSIREKSRTTIRECYEYIEDKLPDNGGWAVGDDFTAIDAYLLVFFRWGNTSGFGMSKNYPKYTQLMKKVASREPVKKTAEVEGIDIFND